MPDHGEDAQAGGFGGGAVEPVVFPGHLQGVEDRVFAVGDGVDAEERVVLEVALHAGEFAEGAFVGGPAVGEKFAFENDFGVGGDEDFVAVAAHHSDGGAAEAAGDFHFVDAGGGFEGGGHVFVGVDADGDGDWEGEAAVILFGVAAAHVRGGEEVDGHFVFGAEHQAGSSRR